MIILSDDYKLLTEYQDYQTNIVFIGVNRIFREKLECQFIITIFAKKLDRSFGALLQLTIRVPAVHTIRTAGGSFLIHGKQEITISIRTNRFS